MLQFLFFKIKMTNMTSIKYLSWYNYIQVPSYFEDYLCFTLINHFMHEVKLMSNIKIHIPSNIHPWSISSVNLRLWQSMLIDMDISSLRKIQNSYWIYFEVNDYTNHIKAIMTSMKDGMNVKSQIIGRLIIIIYHKKKKVDVMKYHW